MADSTNTPNQRRTRSPTSANDTQLDRAVMLRLRQLINAGYLQVRNPRAAAPQETPSITASNNTNNANSEIETVLRPRMDLHEDHESKTMTALLELPGVHIADISLTIRDSKLVVQGQRYRQFLASQLQSGNELSRGGRGGNAAAVTSSGNSRERRVATYHAQQLRYGKFGCSIDVSEDVQRDDVQANLANGILTITWPCHSRRDIDDASMAMS